MIKRINLVRNVGQFDNVSTAFDLKKLTLIYAENGRGKTTLAAIFRSLGSGEALPVTERHRLGAAHPPEVLVTSSGSSPTAHFKNGSWSRTCPDVAVFDDTFIDRNVYSGLEVDADHRQNLHELILGEQGVLLARDVAGLADQIRSRNTELRNTASALQNVNKHGFNLDDFCALPTHDTLDQAIDAAQKRVASMRQADTIRTTPEFPTLALPHVDALGLEALLAKSVADIDAKSLVRTRTHFEKLGRGAEAWVAAGMGYAASLAKGGVDDCPLCDQSLDGSAMFDAYRAHFAAEYKALVGEVSAKVAAVDRTLHGDALAGFERQVQTVRTRHAFWADLCSVPPIDIDSTELASVWQKARDGVLAALKAKHADPLAVMKLEGEGKVGLERYEAAAIRVVTFSSSLQRANEDVARVKEAAKSDSAAAAQAALDRLRAIRARHEPATSALCSAYLGATLAKTQAEAAKASAQMSLDAHRVAVFPKYQTSINDYLGRFNAGFTVVQVQPQNAAGTPSCTYHLDINKHSVPVAGKAGATFKNTLSAGDRNTLALAFFFASLDRDPKKSSKVVVLDDPMSSLDEHRCIATVQQTRSLVPHVAQVIVLSHSKPFLARIWQHADHAATKAIEVKRAPVGSTIEEWNVKDDSVTEYDKRHARLRDFVDTNTGSPRETAEAIRPVLEGYLRVACAADFPSGTLLGPFRQLAKNRALSGTSIVGPTKLTELESLIEYGNKFHHDTNPAWDTESINDGELHGFAKRTLDFVRA